MRRRRAGQLVRALSRRSGGLSLFAHGVARGEGFEPAATQCVPRASEALGIPVAKASKTVKGRGGPSQLYEGCGPRSARKIPYDRRRGVQGHASRPEKLGLYAAPRGRFAHKFTAEEEAQEPLDIDFKV